MKLNNFSLPLLLIFCFLIFEKKVNAQVPNLVITEIMYNPPEMGTDSLEYIEIFNNENDAINLQGVKFTSGLTHVFPNLILESNEYIVIAKDSIAFHNNFGSVAYQWNAGTLSNSGESLELKTANDETIDFVEYQNISPWTTAANGLGASLVLCDFSSDNSLPENWGAATTATSIIINNQEIIANPNLPSDCPTGPIIGFIGDVISLPEEDITIDLQITIENGNANPTEVIFLVSTASTATLNDDFTLGNMVPLTITFPAGVEKDTQIVSVQILEDLDIEPNEIAAFAIGNPNNGAIVDPMHFFYEIIIEDDDATLPDLVISEIMYNPPESGSDSTEFIELYNNDTLAIDLVDYYFSEGINFTFPDVILNPSEYIVIARDSNAFESYYGFSPLQWSSGSLTNSGEIIELRNAGGSIADVVEYSNTAQWSADANGLGASLVLCDVDADNNNPTNWEASISNTGILIDGKEVMADPAMPNECLVPLASFPIRPIGIMTTTNTEGVLDSLNQKCELQGIVHGVNLNLSNGGLQFVLIDDSEDGITVYSNSETFGYNVVEGDEIIVQGTLAQFRGLAEIIPDTLWKVSDNNTLTIPQEVSNLNETTENQLIQIKNLSIIDPTQWDNSSTNGFSVDVTNGTDTFEMRIDQDVDLFDLLAPDFSFNLTGLGGQFDSDAPYLEGYQILPRYVEDIEMISSAVNLNWKNSIQFFPNPIADFLTIKMESPMEKIELRNVLGQLVFSKDHPKRLEVIPTSSLNAGIYFLSFYQNNNTITYKLVK